MPEKHASDHCQQWNDARSGDTMVIAATFGLRATLGEMAALLPSLAIDLAPASGLSIDAVAGTIIVGYSVLPLPYQVPPSVVGYQMACVPHRSAVLTTLWIKFVTAVVSVPCQFLWWRVIGFDCYTLVQ